MNKLFHLIKRITFWIFFVLLFLVTLTTVLSKIYEDDIEQYAITEINKHIITEVKIRDIDFSILSNFPYASLNFQHVLIKDAYEKIESDDTLLYAKNLYLNFNILDIINEDYNVRNISIKEGILKIKTTSRGDVNYNITKPSIDTSASNFTFALKQLSTEDLKFEFSNIATKQFYKLLINEADFEGNFSETEFNLKASSKLHIEKLKTNSFSLIKNKAARLNLDLHINTLTQTYTFNTGDLSIEKMPFQITGQVNSKQLDIKIKGENIKLDELTKSLLNNTIDVSNNYESYGNVNFTATIKGEVAKTQMPSIKANFDIKNGKIKSLEKNLSVTNLNIEGRYQNKQPKQKELLEFKNISLQLLKSTFSGSTKITDFKTPTFNGSIKGHLDLASFHDFFKFENVEQLTGIIDINTAYSIQFSDIEYNPSKFNLENTHGDLTLKNITFKSSDNPIKFNNISGDLVLKGNDAGTKNLSIKTDNSDLVLNGAIKNLIPFIEGTGTLGVIASIESKKLDINEFINSAPHNKKIVTQKPFELPKKLHINIDLNVEELIWQTHNFKKIRGKFILANQAVNIKYFNLQTLQGAVSGNLKLDNLLEKGNSIEGQIKLTDINVKLLFADWNNFNQTAITDKNLTGTLSGDIDLLLFFDQYFTLIDDKMFAKTNFKINNGAITRMETMLSITEFMRSNKTLKLMLNKHIDKFETKLLNLTFEELSNTLEIKNRKLYIPKMTIKSNALDVNLSGWHDFDNNIDYHFSFRFRELKSDLNESEFGIIEDDGLGWKIFLNMDGQLDDPTYSIDKGEMKATFKENITEEKQTMKSVLKSEFGLFKKDSTVKQMKSDPKNEAFEFIIYEEENDTQVKTDSLSRKSRNKKHSNKLFEKLKQKSIEEQEVEDESDFE
jgi:hypothetical protein